LLALSHSQIASEHLDILAHYHNDSFGHYSASQLTQMLAAHDVSWPTADADAAAFISQCPTCAIAQVSTTPIPITADQLVTLRNHHNHIMGHHGIDMTLRLLRLHGHTWHGIKSHVVELVQFCRTPELTTAECKNLL
jgi:hypothetical protein